MRRLIFGTCFKIIITVTDNKQYIHTFVSVARDVGQRDSPSLALVSCLQTQCFKDLCVLVFTIIKCCHIVVFKHLRVPERKSLSPIPEFYLIRGIAFVSRLTEYLAAYAISHYGLKCHRYERK